MEPGTLGLEDRDLTTASTPPDQCRNDEEMAKMWEACKISIGKRCQNLRIDDNSRLV